MIKSNRGQLSIFMGITLIIVMGMLAFIINVGLFVKAKINLQNATDAAAFAGAATQARQLTNVAYVNWELRNTYKEWMFKYYVLGQLGLMHEPYNLSNSKISGDHPVSYLLETPPISGVLEYDKYNVPSICVHNNSKTNICPMFSLPGIPRFPAIGVAGISEIHEAFVNRLVEEKGIDCSRRSKANFLTALTWAYGSGKNDIPEAPLVASNRPGAWPEALELAMRIRNLEMIMNRPPVADMTRQNITNLKADDLGLNERPIKAFWSAYRNLGGGAYKDKLDGSEELSANLSLTELPPLAYPASPLSVSGFLIPPKFTYPEGGGNALQKYYVDLQLMPVNYATMFSTFVDTSNVNGKLDNVFMEGTCSISKSALPVPGYILGFNKNPEVLTYYAVKAESKFIGLFFPISSGDSKDGIKLTAYAAAKPFGGRIGPKLFRYTTGDQSVEGRFNDQSHRSPSYVNGFLVDKNALGFTPGMPIPFGSDFWVTNGASGNPVIGGVPGSGTPIFFGIPNMIYDFELESDLAKQADTNFLVQDIAMINIKGLDPKENLGLNNSKQFKALKASIGTISPGTSMTGEEVLKAIIRARRPTKYDVINYLVPDFRETIEKANNAAPTVRRLAPVSNVGYTYRLFAPLAGQGLLYETAPDILSTIRDYMTANDPAVGTYLKALLAVSKSIYNMVSQGDTKGAALSIHPNAAGNDATPADLVEPSCKDDMATKFNHFFRAEAKACGLVPLKQLMVDFIESHSNNPENKMYYTGYYYSEPTNSALALTPEQLMTAYFPGPRQGTSGDGKGVAEHPLKLSSGGNSYSTKRNYYSTKFFQMAKIMDSPPMTNSSTNGRRDYEEQPLLREQVNERPNDLAGVVHIKNYLKYDSTTGINNNYFLDF